MVTKCHQKVENHCFTPSGDDLIKPITSLSCFPPITFNITSILSASSSTCPDLPSAPSALTSQPLILQIFLQFLALYLLYFLPYLPADPLLFLIWWPFTPFSSKLSKMSGTWWPLGSARSTPSDLCQSSGGSSFLGAISSPSSLSPTDLALSRQHIRLFSDWMPGGGFMPWLGWDCWKTLLQDTTPK